MDQELLCFFHYLPMPMCTFTANSLLIAVLCWPTAASYANDLEGRSGWLSVTMATDGIPLFNQHPSLALAIKKAAGNNFLMECQAMVSSTMYGLFQGEHMPRPHFGSLSALLAILPSELGNLELATGMGVVFGQKEGERYYHHIWQNGIFPTSSYESRRLVYLDVALPFVAQWRFTRRRTTGLGLDFSCLWSPEVVRWNMGLSMQFGLGASLPVTPPPSSQPKIIPEEEPSQGPVKEELEE